MIVLTLAIILLILTMVISEIHVYRDMKRKRIEQQRFEQLVKAAKNQFGAFSD